MHAYISEQKLHFLNFNCLKTTGLKILKEKQPFYQANRTVLQI